MRAKGYCDLGFAKLDTDRMRRRGFPEVVYAPGKTDEQLRVISLKIICRRQPLLITKIGPETFALLKKSLPHLEYNSQGRIAYLKNKTALRTGSFVLVVTGGTSDTAVAEEAAATLEVMGCRVRRLYDVGVSGVHRVMAQRGLLRRAKVIVVVAGMEGALASLISGLISHPVIAVPTSIGYGANFKGLSALLTMLNSCSPGVAVVNIDNGFGGGYIAALINKA